MILLKRACTEKVREICDNWRRQVWISAVWWRTRVAKHASLFGMWEVRPRWCSVKFAVSPPVLHHVLKMLYSTRKIRRCGHEFGIVSYASRHFVTCAMRWTVAFRVDYGGVINVGAVARRSVVLKTRMGGPVLLATVPNASWSYLEGYVQPMTSNIKWWIELSKWRSNQNNPHILSSDRAWWANISVPRPQETK